MLDTTRIRSGFDVELQLGGGWFKVALQALADAGQLLPSTVPPNTTVHVTAVHIVFDPPDRDLAVEMTLAGLPVQLLASLALTEDGSVLVITTDLPGMPGVQFSVPFNVLGGLAAPPRLKKVVAENGFAPAIAVLANLDLRASPQAGEPLPVGQHVPRGAPELAQSFLPTGLDLALGVGRCTWPLFGNDIWHTQLRAKDGTHPILDAANKKKGSWRAVGVSPRKGKIRIALAGKIPIENAPDMKISVRINLKPRLVDGALTFRTRVDTDFDTGLLGDLFFAAGFLLGLVGFILGMPGLLSAGVIGGISGEITVQVVEYVVEGMVRKQVLASLAGESLTSKLTCSAGVVVVATPSPAEGLSISFLDAVPRSIRVGTSRPDALHERHTVVTSNFSEIQMDASGLAVAGSATAGELFQPLQAMIVDRLRDPDVGDSPGPLRELVYRTSDGATVNLKVPEALKRVREGELTCPLRLSELSGSADLRMPTGRLATVCLLPTAIRRKETIITDIRFSSGVDLRVSEAVALQDAGVLILPRHQLIHPKDADPYFRSPPDSTEENNLENLPPF